MKYLILLLALVGTTLAIAQHTTCDGERYATQVFEEIDITSDVKFGENTTFGGVFQELKMDVYEPRGDEAEQRPVVIFAFGGAFTVGNRETMRFLCEDFSRRGFIAATIDYRLLDGIAFDSSLIYDTVIRAVSDMAASVRYFREDAATANQFRADPNQIFVGGISAGAITAAHLAYLNEDDNYIPLIAALVNRHGGFPGNSSTNLEYSSAVQGVINYSGALKDANWIDENDPPCFSAHDDGDQVVPYGKGFSSAFPFGNYLEGSLEMSARLEALGIANELITVTDSDEHVSFFNPSSPNFGLGAEVIERSALFLHTILCETSTNTESLAAGKPFTLFPNPSMHWVNLELDASLSNYNVLVHDYSGKLVYQAANTQQLDLSALPRGLYQVNVQTEHTIATQKLILQ